jgi:hypothetical protein
MPSVRHAARNSPAVYWAALHSGENCRRFCPIGTPYARHSLAGQVSTTRGKRKGSAVSRLGFTAEAGRGCHGAGPTMLAGAAFLVQVVLAEVSGGGCSPVG